MRSYDFGIVFLLRREIARSLLSLVYFRCILEGTFGIWDGAARSVRMNQPPTRTGRQTRSCLAPYVQKSLITITEHKNVEHQSVHGNGRDTLSTWRPRRPSSLVNWYSQAGGSAVCAVSPRRHVCPEYLSIRRKFRNSERIEADSGVACTHVSHANTLYASRVCS